MYPERTLNKIPNFQISQFEKMVELSKDLVHDGHFEEEDTKII